MEFRLTYCQWCGYRNNPVENCQECPKYLRYGSGTIKKLIADDLCSSCAHVIAEDMKAFCKTNRFYQQDSPEDFECYKFFLTKGGHA